MDYLPVYFTLKDRDCLVVGGGTVARRKVDLLLRAEGRVTVVAPRIEPTLAELATEGRLTHHAEEFRPEHLEGQNLVVSATEKKEVNREVAESATARHLPVNVVDDPELSTVIFPAIVDRSPVVIAVSTGGASPVLARLLKARLESLIPPAYGELAALAGTMRDRVKAAFGDGEARRKYWETVFQGPPARLFLGGEQRKARRMMDAMLEEGPPPPAGSVTVLCINFDDPELLTLKALRHLQEADTVVLDPDVPDETVDMARRDAEKIVVGHATGRLAVPREDIPQLLVRLSGDGQHVVRLRHGFNPRRTAKDEELQALVDANVPVAVVLGVDATPI